MKKGDRMPRTIARMGVVLVTALATLALSAGVAAAHVTVSSTDAAPGGFGKLTFRVPNESDTASTVAIRIQIPEEAAMASLRAQPLPGWTVSMTTTDLEEPLEAHGQEISSYVSVVEFRAEDGAGIGPGEFQEFAISGGPFPDAETVSYPIVQSYSDGSESAWIEPVVDGQEPERPAPTLSFTGAADGHGASDDAAEPSEAATETASAATDDGGDTTATVALVLGGLGLVAGLAGLALGLSARRRTVAG
jgi:periplasmic copper chaperone A